MSSGNLSFSYRFQKSEVARAFNSQAQVLRQYLHINKGTSLVKPLLIQSCSSFGIVAPQTAHLRAILLTIDAIEICSEKRGELGLEGRNYWLYDG